MQGRPPRRAGLLLFVLAVGLLAACDGVWFPHDDVAYDIDALTVPSGVDREAGADRFATAAALASGVAAERVWVATGRDFADALTAAAAGDGPVLLSEPDGVPEATEDALAGRDEPRVAVGGEDALSDSVAEALDLTDRAGGADRYETAAAIAGETHPDGADVVYLATGDEFADALSAAPTAADGEARMLLAGHTLPAATAEALETLEPDDLVAVGGPAALPDEVVDEAVEAAGGALVERVAGADRYETAAQVSTHRDLTEARTAYLATGEDFPDALAAAPAAASEGAPLLLTRRDELPEATRAELERLEVERVVVAGGTAAVGEGVAEEVRALLDTAAD
ncbi:cell wall-binding repeat-containing protein [Egibacter rhizosphaerae]|uniref:Cell wall-binding repeat-containing protein n=1 Tax=Egibacter rhizosphaerae TaxID=1670831 RepID=A0A411YBY8_9ACTN|nr:cell wall-binding repeat-containing protein [Egibacter rhizosphaerae]QBI18720.1 cell wall-binding repeat-containing protein [Egibacter rhizosphaerae]